VEGRNQALISASGFFDGKNWSEFDHLKIKEHVKHSWYADVPAEHPWKEPFPTPVQSQHLADSDFNGKYSWAKAPRYDGFAAEAGPLSRVIMNANPNNLSHQIQDPALSATLSPNSGRACSPEHWPAFTKRRACTNSSISGFRSN
jgi:Ni,Fe-hydrogenase I large subunit